MKLPRIIIAAILLSASGCSRPDNSTLIQTEIQKLSLTMDSEAFLIIREKHSLKFIQFTGRKLKFDLPRKALSEPEFEKARRLLAPYGIKPTTYRFKDPQTGKSSAQTSFQKSLSGDVALATKLAETVLFEVYDFNQKTKLKFIGN